jgi:hypothetical protein
MTRRRATPRPPCAHRDSGQTANGLSPDSRRAISASTTRLNALRGGGPRARRQRRSRCASVPQCQLTRLSLRAELAQQEGLRLAVPRPDRVLQHAQRRVVAPLEIVQRKHDRPTRARAPERDPSIQTDVDRNSAAVDAGRGAAQRGDSCGRDRQQRRRRRTHPAARTTALYRSRADRSVPGPLPRRLEQLQAGGEDIVREWTARSDTFNLATYSAT